jgi:hypothetical protein
LSADASVPDAILADAGPSDATPTDAGVMDADTSATDNAEPSNMPQRGCDCALKESRSLPLEGVGSLLFLALLLGLLRRP